MPVLRFVSFRKIHRELRQHLCYGLVRNGMTEIRCQLTQRLQYKITILHIYMRNHQILGSIHQIIIEDNIQIQCPGPQ